MPAADSASPKPRSSLAGAALVGLLLAASVLIAAGFLIAWQINHPPPPAASPAELASLRARLATDETRLAAFDKALHAQGDLAARIAKLETTPDPTAAARLADIDLRLAALERAYADLPQRLATLQADQSTLAGRVAHLETLDPTDTMKRAAAELAFANLARASADGPFAAELKTFAALLPGTPQAAALAPIAPHGAPTRAVLAAQFPDVAAACLAAEKSASAKTWFGRLLANLANVVVIRRVGAVKGRDSEAILARAGGALRAGDLGGAAAEVATLKGAAAPHAQAWLADAKGRLAIERNLGALADQLARRLTAP